MVFFSLSNLSKSYGNNKALCDVCLRINAGEVHALMGENGAGKSTLIKVIAGLVAPDTMDLLVDGTPVSLSSPADAKNLGFRFIHQELNIVPQLSVAENILLGHPYPRRFSTLIDWKELERRAQAALDQLNITHISANQKISQLSTGDQMLIKIASTLVSDDALPGRLYIMDEPTAALTAMEADKLFNVIEQLKDEGAAILYVSHRLDEVMRICERITILRDAKHILSEQISNLSTQQIIQHMTGREVKNPYPSRKSEIGKNNRIQCKDLTTTKVSNLNFSVKEGEILGIAGLANMGQSQVLQALLGLDKTTSGVLLLNEKSALLKSPSDAWKSKLAYVPRERRSQALMLNRSIFHNITLPHLKKLCWNFGIVKPGHEKDLTQKLAQKVRLKAAHLSQPVYQLSGGNQQKSVFARAIGAEPELLLLDEPTRGVDIGAKFDIYALIRDLSAAGTSIVLTSSDLPELVALCDSIVIMKNHSQQKIMPANGITATKLLQELYE